MQNKGEKIDTSKLGCRPFNPQIARQQLALNFNKFISWGATKWAVDSLDKYKECKFLKFYVSGMKFKGYIFIELDGSDTYNVYYCTTHGTIKDSNEMVYGDMICDIIDDKIEKVDGYNF